MSANIEELVKKHLDRDGWTVKHSEIPVAIRNALSEQAETHAIELRAYEATVQNLEQRIREIERSRKECEQVREAAMGLKDVCNRPSAARTRAEAWRALDKAIKAAPEPKEGE